MYAGIWPVYFWMRAVCQVSHVMISPGSFLRSLQWMKIRAGHSLCLHFLCLSCSLLILCQYVSYVSYVSICVICVVCCVCFVCVISWYFLCVHMFRMFLMCSKWTTQVCNSLCLHLLMLLMRLVLASSYAPYVSMCLLCFLWRWCSCGGSHHFWCLSCRLK